MVTTTRAIQGLNPATDTVINYMSGVRTKKQIVGEFFGLREEAVYDDNGDNVIDFINDFKDEKTLEAKRVCYNTRLGELGVSESDFNILFYGIVPNYGKKVEKVVIKPTVIEKPTEDTLNELETLREEYKAKFGKYPTSNIKLETLKVKLK